MIQNLIEDVPLIYHYFRSSEKLKEANQQELRVKVQNAALRTFALLGAAVAAGAYLMVTIPVLMQTMVPWLKTGIPLLISILFYDLYKICQNGDRTAIAKATAMTTNGQTQAVGVEQPGFKNNALYTFGTQIIGTFSRDANTQSLARQNLKVLTEKTTIVGFLTGYL